MERAIWVRIGIAVVLSGYAVIIWTSHFIAPPLFLGGLMAFIGWLFLPGLYVLTRLRRIDLSRAAQPSIKELLQPWALTAAFGAIAALTLFLAIGWDVPSFCQSPLYCTKGYHWSSSDGHYYHTTADGKYSEISQQTYIEEVGTDLRSAASFGIYAMSLAWIAAGALRAPSKA